MIVAAHQLHYLPWIRLVDKIARSDAFIVLDDVQFTKNGYQNRVKIKHAQGTMLLTVPVLDPMGQRICDVRINTITRWRAKHRAALATNYGRAPFYAAYHEAIDAILDRPWESLSECSLCALGVLLPALGVKTRLVRSSELGVPGRGTERLIGMCRMLGATEYLTGDFAVGHHFDPDAFTPYDIKVRRQAWVCPSYRQQYPQLGFLPELSVVDLLLNEGPRSLEILMTRELASPPPTSREGGKPEDIPAFSGEDGQPRPVDSFARSHPDASVDSSVCRTTARNDCSYTGSSAFNKTSAAERLRGS
jgi:hypothetical protein